ncbi:hypothetical protein NA57DRAFT_42219 [Rhizodiscina lignyota]|uniref:SART-1 protein n=1 Tax=Rhizodiscina lignyota TaxID=1504668 RepID=A0A9P4I9V1_9PEZI|nr:hypothetical protein NA57DRAFT_42219 [Rhizodiscina lignyota]
MPEFDVEQVNKVRLAMGMKPLPVPGAPSGPVFKDAEDQASDEEPGSTLETREAAASDNWKKLRDEEEAKAKRQAQKDAIKKARDIAQRNATLEGKGLADDDDEVDTKAWLMQHNKSKKKLEKARKLEQLEQELAERERQAEYTAADLAGVRVGHELNQFDEEAGEQILILKDAAVDADSEEDELENVNLREREKLEERLESKKKRPVYDPNAEDDDTSRGILAQYDEEIDGRKRQRFTLDGHGSTREAAMDVDSSSAKLKGITISLDILKEDAPISDYVDASEMKIKKPKKKKSKSTKRKVFDDEDIFAGAEMGDQQGEMEIDGKDMTVAAPSGIKRNFDDTNFVDDEDLQADLAKQRRAALKKRKKMRPEDIARELRQEEVTTPGVVDSIEAQEEEEPGLVIDETSEFVANLQKPTASERRRPRSALPLNGVESVGAGARSPDDDEDVDMEQSYNEVDEERSQSRGISREVSTPAEVTATGLEDEATLTSGIGATLKMLRQRGLIKTPESGDMSINFRDRQRFLAEKQKRETEAEQRARAQRERDRQSGKLDRMSARDREEYARRVNVQRDQNESRQMVEVFNREYKPDVQLKYVDDYGRSMNQKEAFKHLSHQFHGKGSGKQKTEKRLKKIEEEKRKEAMSILDASQNSTNMNSAVGDRAKKNRQAGVRLQ